jgi:hypothetical protein
MPTNSLVLCTFVLQTKTEEKYEQSDPTLTVYFYRYPTTLCSLMNCSSVCFSSRYSKAGLAKKNL